MTAEFAVGQHIGDYEILSILGVGGMGKVYKVRNVISDRLEAMKILLPDLSSNQGLADRFLREIRLLATLNHPNIAALRTALTHGNQLVMIMEFVEGETLANRLARAPFHSRGGQLRRSDTLGAELRAQAEYYPPGYQAGKHDAHLRGRREIDGLRHRPLLNRWFAHIHRHDARLSELHAARAGTGRGGRRAVGHLFVRSVALRDADRQTALPRRLAIFPDDRAPQSGTASPHRASQRSSRRAERNHPDVHRQGSCEPVSIRRCASSGSEKCSCFRAARGRDNRDRDAEAFHRRNHSNGYAKAGASRHGADASTGTNTISGSDNARSRSATAAWRRSSTVDALRNIAQRFVARDWRTHWRECAGRRRRVHSAACGHARRSEQSGVPSKLLEHRAERLG